MRYSRSSASSKTHAAWMDADAAWLKIYDRDDKHLPFGQHSDASKEALTAKCAALDAFLLTPCRHPGDVAAKLDVIWKEELFEKDDFGLLRSSLKRDLLELSRPGASEAMKTGWARWAAAINALEYGELVQDDDGDAASDEHAAAFRGILAIPCTTAGDFLVKAYVELITECEHSARQPSGFLFEVKDDWRSDQEHYLENDAREAAIDDLDNCDLGRCMMALGSLDFEPSAWIAAAKRANVAFHLIIERGGQRSFCFKEFSRNSNNPVARKREMRVRALINFNHEARYQEVADEIEQFHPDLIIRVGDQPVAREAA